MVSVTTEHKAVLDPLARLGSQGFDITLLAVEPAGSAWAGWLAPERVAEAIRDDTCLVSVMLANNEIGVIQPLAEIGAICKERDVLLHCDATQAVGKIPVDVRRLGVDLMSFSAHKMYGPKGVGALYVRNHDPIVRLTAQISGGGQQQGRRSGTLNVPGIVGFAAALRLCIEEMPTEMPRLKALRDRLVHQMQAQVDGTALCGPGLDPCDESGELVRLPGNANLTFRGVDGEALLLAMDHLAVSSGATCASSDPEPSHVLRGLGLDDDMARSSLRFGLGRFNTPEQVDFAVESVVTAVRRLRHLASA
jgi:cysteine desulfurase